MSSYAFEMFFSEPQTGDCFFLRLFATENLQKEKISQKNRDLG